MLSYSIQDSLLDKNKYLIILSKNQDQRQYVMTTSLQMNSVTWYHYFLWESKGPPMPSPQGNKALFFGVMKPIIVPQ